MFNHDTMVYLYHMDFAGYLKSKKIDPEKFRASQPALFSEWSSLFDHVHHNSFTQQKLFLINEIRRKYILEEKESVAPPASTNRIRPKIK